MAVINCIPMPTGQNESVGGGGIVSHFYFCLYRHAEFLSLSYVTFNHH